MWSWLTGGGGSSGARSRINSVLSRPREFTLESMRQLHEQLLKFTELGDAEIVELLRVLSEFLIYSDQNHSGDDADAAYAARTHAHNTSTASSSSLSPLPPSPDASAPRAGVFFDYFCEKNILGLFVQLGASRLSVAVQVQLLQTLSILVQNIATRTSLYYILSNNYVNKLLECPFAYNRDDDVRDWFVTLLKALSLRLNTETVQFFLDDTRKAFPLYTQALQFRRCSETMVKVAVKTLTLNVYRVADDRVRQFIVTYERMAYFRDTVDYTNELALRIQGLVNTWQAPLSLSLSSTSASKHQHQQHQQQPLGETLEEAIDEYIDHCFYLQDILDVDLPALCYRVGDLIYKRHVRSFVAASVLPDCNPLPQRVSTRLALYLLTRLLSVLEHAPLVNAIAFMLLSPDANERCPYSAVALGAGAKRKTSSHRTSGSTTNATALPPTKRKASKKPKKPRHAFQAHATAATCDSPLCYLQTRYRDGEWPADEVRAFAATMQVVEKSSSNNNVCRKSILALLASNDERLASTALLLLLAIVTNDAVDHALLRELDLLPFRLRRRKKKETLITTIANVESLRGRQRQEDETEDDATDDAAEGNDARNDAQDDDDRGESSAVSSASTSDVSVSSTSQLEDDGDDGNDGDNDGNSGDYTATAIAAARRPTSPTSPASPVNSSTVVTGQYPHWLLDVLLTTLGRHHTTRLLSTQLAARLVVDIVLDAPPSRLSATSSNNVALSSPPPTKHWLLPRHSAVLSEIHSVSAHQVMESMRGAMADVDLFIYVLEDEVLSFDAAPFPLPINLKSASPIEFLVSLDGTDDSEDAVNATPQDKRTLALRRPTSEIETCRKSMRVFLTLRKLRSLVDEHVVADQLNALVAYRHPHTSALAAATRVDPSAAAAAVASLHPQHQHRLFTPTEATSPHTTVSLDGMVFLSCMWREQRFLHTPAKLLMVLNPEALVFVERVDVVNTTRRRDDDSTSERDVSEHDDADDARGVVRLFAPIHRTYCSVDAKDERVLHVSISSATPVDGCRSYQHKASSSSSGRRRNSNSSRTSDPGELTSWHVSVLFDHKDDCRQAQAHVDLARAEVRAYKLLQIEASLTTHVQITHSTTATASATAAAETTVASPKTQARRRLSQDFDARGQDDNDESNS